MTPKLIRSILGFDRQSETSPDTSRSKTDADSVDIRNDFPSEWRVVTVGDEPNVYEPDSADEHRVRVVVPHLDAGVLVQPVFVDTVFRERAWRVALQTKRKFWETGKQYVYETQWEVWAENRREVDATFEALATDLAAVTTLSDLPMIELDTENEPSTD
jgi:hypothetical protein